MYEKELGDKLLFFLFKPFFSKGMKLPGFSDGPSAD
jgi:hypothetical protein